MLLHHFFGWPKSADACRDRDQRIDHLRMLERKIDRQRASSRDAHQISALDAQKLHQCIEILAIRIRLPWRNQPRIAKASLIITDDPVALGEDSELLVPRSSIQQVSMDEYEGMAARVPLSCAIQIAK